MKIPSIVIFIASDIHYRLLQGVGVIIFALHPVIPANKFK